MFGLLMLPLFVFLLAQWNRARNWAQMAIGLIWGFVVAAALWVFSLLLTWVYMILMPAGDLAKALQDLGAPDAGALMAESLRRHVVMGGGWITLAVVIGLALGLLIRSREKKGRAVSTSASQARSFLILMILVGGLLALAPEFIYLRDFFGTRMNTVFKFFFQTWQIWSVAAAVASVMLLQQLRGAGQALFAGLLVVVLAIGAIYPLFSFSDITRNPLNSLDGASYLSPEIVEAIVWLRQAPTGVLVEAVGGSYDSSYARFSAHSGQPAVLGWPGHEDQWRGNRDHWVRIDAVSALYTASDWPTAQEIIDQYEVRYIVVGSVERGKYVVSEAKFVENLSVAFQNPSVTIYQVP
jgi:uncharacterized membrane protein